MLRWGLVVLRIGLPFQAAFWIVVLSFLMTGGDYESAEHAKGFAAPARKAAGHVVDYVAHLPQFCDDHETLCRQARGFSKFASRQVNSAWDWAGRRYDKVARED